MKNLVKMFLIAVSIVTTASAQEQPAKIEDMRLKLISLIFLNIQDSKTRIYQPVTVRHFVLALCRYARH